MRLGVHLPQWGRAASPASISTAAASAEAQGWDDVWVSDHIAVPDVPLAPPAFLFEPVITLTWAAAATTTVGLGTSVMVLPLRHPVHLAKELASLDQFSGGRLIVGGGAGWLEQEFDALGVPFADRGRRSDEVIDVLRACWGAEDPVTFHGHYHHFHGLKVRPKPAHRIPVWVGGASAPALRRAVQRGDGWHGQVTPEASVALAAHLRAERPDEDFTLSMRVDWDGLITPEDQIRHEYAAYAGAGVQHLVVVPKQADPGEWTRSVDELWRILSSLA